MAVILSPAQCLTYCNPEQGAKLGSIPLVALQVKQPEPPPDLVGQYGRLLALKQQQQIAPLQQQQAQQSVQEGQLDIHAKQVAARDADAMSAAMQQWDGKSLDDLSPLVLKNGGSSTAVMGLKQKALEIKQTYSKIAADDATTGSKNIETKQKANSMVAGALQSLQQVPDAQLGQALTAKAQDLANQGLLDPQHAQMAAQLAQAGDPAAMRQNLALFEKGYKTDNQLLDEAKATEQQRHNQQDETTTAAWRQGELKQGAQRISIEGARLNFEKQKALMGIPDGGQQLTGDSFLQTLPAGTQAQVKAMANGDIAIPPAGARNPQAQQLRTAVLTYDPTYTDARYKSKQMFKTSGDSQNLVQLATAMEHSDRAMANSAKAGFAPMLGNKTLEAGPSAAYMQDAEFLTGEVGKLVKNGVLTVDEGNKISSGMTSARQTVRDASLNETMDLLGGKARAVFQKYKAATGQDLPVGQFFDAKTQQNLTKYGILEGQPQTPAPQSTGGNVTHYKIVNGQLVAQ